MTTTLHGLRPRVRLAREDDLDEIHAIDQRLIGNDASSDTVYHVAEVSCLGAKEIVAYAGHRLPPEWPGVAFFSRSGVLPECRGAGLQKRLIRARLAYLRRVCPEVTHVITYTMVTNAPSSNSLISCGFKLWRPATGDFWIGPEVNYWRRDL